MLIEKIPAAKLNPAAYNPRKDLKPVTRNTKSSSALLRSSVMWNRSSGIRPPVTWLEVTSG